MAKITIKQKRFPQWLPITLILILAAGLYFYELGTESLWVDELLSIDDAKNLDFINVIQGKNSRPIYYILLRFWMQLGSSEAWLRGLCLLFSLGSIFLIYKLARRLLGEPTAAIASLIATLSPLFIHHAQEVRMYAPSTFFTLAGSLLLTYALENPTPRFMGLWAGVRLLGLLTTPLNLLMLFPDTVLFGWKFRHQRRVLLGFVLCLVAIALLWLPVAIHFIYSALDFMGEGHIPAVVDQPDFVRAKPGIFDVIFQLARFTVWPFGRPISEAIYWFYKFYALMLVSLLTIALLSKPRNQERSTKIYWLAAWGILPLIPLFITSQVSRTLWKNRYLLFTSPYLFILLAAGILYIWQRQRKGAMAIAFVYTAAIAGGLMRYHKVLDRGDWRGLVQTIEAKEQPGDTILWALDQIRPVALNHYYDGSSTIEIESAPPYNSEEGITAMEQWFSGLPTNYARFWLVCPVSENNSEIFRTVLEQKFQVESEQVFHGENGSFHLFSLKRLVTGSQK